jgi:hypothetical protein
MLEKILYFEIYLNLKSKLTRRTSNVLNFIEFTNKYDIENISTIKNLKLDFIRNCGEKSKKEIEHLINDIEFNFNRIKDENSIKYNIIHYKIIRLFPDIPQKIVDYYILNVNTINCCNLFYLILYFNDLKSNKKNILIDSYFNSLTNESLALKLNLSQERIRQIKIEIAEILIPEIINKTKNFIIEIEPIEIEHIYYISEEIKINDDIKIKNNTTLETLLLSVIKK